MTEQGPQETTPHAAPGPPPAALPAPLAEDRESASLTQLLHAFETHAAAEADALTTYRSLCASTRDRLTAVLLQLIEADEKHHHELFESLAARLADSAFQPCARPALPQALDPADEATPERREAFRRAMRDEQEGAQSLRALAERDGDLFGGLFGLLLEIMASDSDKHARILRFILQRLEAAA